MSDPRISPIIDWWRAHQPDWFAKSPGFDTLFRVRYGALYRAAVAGDLSQWQDTAEGCLALEILLDQFPRNAFRGRPEMYASDPQARAVARHAIDRGFLDALEPDLRLFLLLPFAHSEDPGDQALSVALHRRYLRSGLHRAERHRDIVARFGRFPHRQPILGQALTPDEYSYLTSGGFQG